MQRDLGIGVEPPQCASQGPCLPVAVRTASALVVGFAVGRSGAPPSPRVHPCPTLRMGSRRQLRVREPHAPSPCAHPAEALAPITHVGGDMLLHGSACGMTPAANTRQSGGSLPACASDHDAPARLRRTSAPARQATGHCWPFLNVRRGRPDAGGRHKSAAAAAAAAAAVNAAAACSTSAASHLRANADEARGCNQCQGTHCSRLYKRRRSGLYRGLRCGRGLCRSLRCGLCRGLWCARDPVRARPVGTRDSPIGR